MENIVENNRIIAEFMGYKILHRKFQYRYWNSSDESYFETNEGNIVCDEDGYEVNLYPDGDPLFELEELPFHSSWDWLMPVVEKIEKSLCTDNKTGNRFYPYVSIGLTHCEITKSQKFVGEDWYVVSRCGNSKIEATWKVVVEFIKWYNNQEKKHD